MCTSSCLDRRQRTCAWIKLNIVNIVHFNVYCCKNIEFMKPQIQHTFPPLPFNILNLFVLIAHIPFLLSIFHTCRTSSHIADMFCNLHFDFLPYGTYANDVCIILNRTHTCTMHNDMKTEVWGVILMIFIENIFFLLNFA